MLNGRDERPNDQWEGSGWLPGQAGLYLREIPGDTPSIADQSVKSMCHIECHIEGRINV